MARTGSRIGDLFSPDSQYQNLFGAPPYYAMINAFSPRTYYKDGQPQKPLEDHTGSDFYIDQPCHQFVSQVTLPHMCLADPFRVGENYVFLLGKRVDTEAPVGNDAYRLVWHVVDKNGAIINSTEFAWPLQSPKWPYPFFNQDPEDVGFVSWWGAAGRQYSNWPSWIVGPIENGGVFERLLVWRETPNDLNSRTIAIPKVAMSPTMAGYEIKKSGSVQQVWMNNTGGQNPRLFTPIALREKDLICNYEQWEHETVENIFTLGSYIAGLNFYESNLPNPVSPSYDGDGNKILPGQPGFNYGENFTPDWWPPPYLTGDGSHSVAWEIPYPAGGTWGAGSPSEGTPYPIQSDVDAVFDWWLTRWGSLAPPGIDPVLGHILYWMNRTSSKVPARHFRGLARLEVDTGNILKLAPGEIVDSQGAKLTGQLRLGWWKSALVGPDQDPADVGVAYPYDAGSPETSQKSKYIPDSVPKVGDARLIFENEWSIHSFEAADLFWPSTWLPNGNLVDWQWLRSNTSLHTTYLPQFTRDRLGGPFTGTPSYDGAPRRYFVTVRMWVDNYVTYPVSSGKKIPADVTSGVVSQDTLRLMPLQASKWSP